MRWEHSAYRMWCGLAIFNAALYAAMLRPANLVHCAMSLVMATVLLVWSQR